MKTHADTNTNTCRRQFRDTLEDAEAELNQWSNACTTLQSVLRTVNTRRAHLFGGSPSTSPTCAPHIANSMPANPSAGTLLAMGAKKSGVRQRIETAASFDAEEGDRQLHVRVGSTSSMKPLFGLSDLGGSLSPKSGLRHRPGSANGRQCFTMHLSLSPDKQLNSSAVRLQALPDRPHAESTIDSTKNKKRVLPPRERIGNHCN